MFTQAQEGSNDVTLVSIIPRQESGPRVVPAFDLINVVEKIEEVLSLEQPNGQVQPRNNHKNKDVGVHTANTKGRKY